MSPTAVPQSPVTDPAEGPSPAASGTAAGAAATDDGHVRARRADAQRNYERIVTAAREAFSERGASTSLEEIARRAGVGIGTLYRNFPNRPALLEAVYLQEVESLADAAAGLVELEPWDAFAGWIERFIAYFKTKRALAAELLDTIGPDTPLFMQCRGTLYASATPLVERAQAAGELRPDTSIAEIIQLVGGVAKIPDLEQAQTDHLVAIALDGLRAR